MPQVAPASYQATTPEITGLETQLKDLQTQTDARLAPIREQRDQATTALQQEISQPLPKTPTLEPVPQFHPKQITPEETQSFVAISTALAALASLATRAPLTSALNAAGAAMEGFHKGALDQANLDLKNFKTQADAAVARNNQQLQQYDAVLKNRNLAMSQKMSMLRVIAAKEQDEIALAQLKSQDLRSFLELQQKRLDGMNRWNEFAAKFHQSAQQHADTLAQKKQAEKDKRDALAGQTLSESQVEPSAWMFLLTGKMPSLGFGAAQNRVQIISAAQKIGESMGLSPQEQAMLPFNTKAQQHALDFMTKWAAGIKRSEEVVNLNGQLMLEEAKKLPLSDIQAINKGIVAGMKQFGSPEAQAYANYAITVRNEYARVMSGPMSNAMLHEGATARADEALSGAGSISQLEAALAAMKKEMANQDVANQHTIEGIHMAMTVHAMKPTEPGGVPEGVDPNVWKYMTPEEKDLWH